MIRALALLVQIALLVGAAVWLADHPGRITILWLGWRIDTSVAILLVAIAAVVLAVVLFLRLWRFLRHAPGHFVAARRAARRRRGHRALKRALVALAAGDAESAQRHARRAAALLDDPAPTRLLLAQAARLLGDATAARREYEALLGDAETEIAGLRGLLEQAMEAGDAETALRLAKRIRRLRPDADWAALRLVDLHVAAERWADADAALAEALRGRALAAEEGRRKRAAVLVERGRQAEADDDRAAALGFLREAYDLDPTLVPAAVGYARLLAGEGKTKRAIRVLEQAWARVPHPEIALAYRELAGGEEALEQVKALERLLALRPESAEGHLALAEAALEARLWGAARNHLERAAESRMTVRVCELMARLEEAEHGDLEEARAWLAKAARAPRENAWSCRDCGRTMGEWRARCAGCGRLATLVWRAPKEDPFPPLPEAGTPAALPPAKPAG